MVTNSPKKGDLAPDLLFLYLPTEVDLGYYDYLYLYKG